MIRRKYIITLLPVFFFLLTACNDFPKDPGNTLENVKNGRLRVGIAESGKWASFCNGEPQGIEVELIQQFAESLRATPEWIPATQDELIRLLEADEIDIAIGGFVRKSPFETFAGWTRPYHIEEIKVGAPPGIALPENIKDRRILVKKGSPASVAVKKNKGIPVLYDSLSSPSLLMAAPLEELQQYRLKIGEDELDKIEHVLAIQKGENAFLECLERFIAQYDRKQ